MQTPGTRNLTLSTLHIYHNSKGGLIASLYAQKYSQYVSHLILAAPAFSPRIPFATCPDYICTNYLNGTHSIAKSLEWIELQKEYPSIVVTSATEDYFQAYCAASEELAKDEYHMKLTLPTLLLVAGNDKPHINALTEKYRLAKPNYRYARYYSGSFFQILHEVDSVVADLKSEMKAFLSGMYLYSSWRINSIFGIYYYHVYSFSYIEKAPNPTSCTKSLLEEEGACKDGKENRELSIGELFLDRFLPRLTKLLTLADFRDKSFKSLQVINLMLHASF